METFDNGDIEDWQELNAHDAALGSWEVILSSYMMVRNSW